MSALVKSSCLLVLNVATQRAEQVKAISFGLIRVYLIRVNSELQKSLFAMQP